MKLVIEGDEGRKSVVPVRDEMTIGRDDGNTVRLPDRNVSRRHARLFQENGKLLIEDLGSFNGVRVNGRKIVAPTAVEEGDLIEVGDYDLSVQGKIEAAKDPVVPGPQGADRDPDRLDPPPAETPSGERATQPLAADDAAADKRARSAMRVGVLAIVLLTALVLASWFFRSQRANRERARHGETHPFARAPVVAEPAPVEVPAPRAAAPRAAEASRPAQTSKPERPANTVASSRETPDAPPAANGARAAEAVPTSPAPPPSPPPAAEAKEAQATRLAAASNEKLNAHDFEGAVSDAQAALELAPTARDTLCTAYHSLGYGFSYLNDNRSAKKYLEQFKPCCASFGETACAQVEEFLAR